MIAQTYAVKYCLPSQEARGEISTLTLACTYSAPGPFCSRMFNFWADVAQRMSLADVMHDLILWCFTPAFFSNPDKKADLEAFEKEMSRIDEDMGVRSYLAQLNVIIKMDTTAEIGKLADAGMKVIVLAGDCDILIPTSLSRELADMIPGCTWQSTKGGHACTWEYSNEFNEAYLKGIREAS
jgi:3-oxoadipate enol-lactonase